MGDLSPKRPGKEKEDSVFLLILILAALALRLDSIFASKGVIDADEAIVGLMGKHILEGQEMPVFYYGQPYMGSLEAVFAAFSFRIFDISNYALKLVPLAFSLLLIYLLYRITEEIWDKTAARCAAILCAIGPSALVVWSAKARGGFMEILVIGSLALLFLLRWLKEQQCSLKGFIPVGILFGIGWWVNNQIIYFMLPSAYAALSAVLWQPGRSTSWKSRRLLSLGILALVCFLFGGLPFWIYNLTNSFESFQIFHAAPPRNALRYLAGIFKESLPILLGARRFWQNKDYFSGASWLVYASYAIPLLILLSARWRQFKELFVLRIDTERPVELCCLLIASCIVVFAGSSFGFLTEAPRYLFPLYVGLFPLVGISLQVISERSRSIAAALFAVILAVNLLSSYPGKREAPGEPIVYHGERVVRDHSELISWLREKHFSWVRTNYWIGYKLAFETKEEIRFIVFQEPWRCRIPSYDKEGIHIGFDKVPLVLVPSQLQQVRRALGSLKYSYREVKVGGYFVIYDMHSPFEDRSPITISYRAETFDRPDAAQFGVDGNVKTRWLSSEPQHPGMIYKVIFDAARSIRGISYCLGDWAHDYPLGLWIIGKDPDGNTITLLEEKDYAAIRYMALSRYNCDNDFVIPLKPALVREVWLMEMGKHPIFAWSIADLKFFEDG